MPSITANEAGFALVVLSLVFAGAALIRRFASPLRALFLPTAVIGGFLALSLGPEGLGRIIGSYGLFTPETSCCLESVARPAHQRFGRVTLARRAPARAQGHLEDLRTTCVDGFGNVRAGSSPWAASSSCSYSARSSA